MFSLNRYRDSFQSAGEGELRQAGGKRVEKRRHCEPTHDERAESQSETNVAGQHSLEDVAEDAKGPRQGAARGFHGRETRRRFHRGTVHQQNVVYPVQ